MQCAEGSRADFCFARTAFRNDKRRFLAVKLSLDSLRHRKLDIIEGIAGLLHDIVIDSEYFIRKRLSGWIEDGHELIADTVSDGHAEGIEIPCDIVDLVKPVRGAGYSAGDLNGPGLQPLLQYLYDFLSSGSRSSVHASIRSFCEMTSNCRRLPRFWSEAST